MSSSVFARAGGTLGLLVLLVACGDSHGASDAAPDTAPDARGDAGTDAAPADAGPDTGLPPQCSEPGGGFPPSLLPPCPSMCGGRCVSRAMIPDEIEATLDECSGTHLCVPDDFIAGGASYVPDTCRSVANVEGRCLSTCLPQIRMAAGTVPQGTCAENHLCVPCFDPTDGRATGACETTCDPGPAEPPYVFSECCDGAATCVPADAIPEESRALFDDDICPDDPPSLCVPNEILGDPDYVPPSCTTGRIAEMWGAAYGPGACLPVCLGSVMGFVGFLEQNDCAGGNVCVPCLDPIDGTSTGACGDEPPPDLDAGVPDAGASDAGAPDAA